MTGDRTTVLGLGPGVTARGSSPAIAAPIDSVVRFAIAGAAYALDVAVVRELVTVERLVAVPGTPAPVVGAFPLRGATLALVDGRILFGLPAGGERSRALVIARGHRALCGLTIDQVSGVTRFVEAQFTPAVPGREPPLVAGFLAEERGGAITMLDAPALVRSLGRLGF